MAHLFKSLWTYRVRSTEQKSRPGSIHPWTAAGLTSATGPRRVSAHVAPGAAGSGAHGGGTRPRGGASTRRAPWPCPSRVQVSTATGRAPPSDWRATLARASSAPCPAPANFNSILRKTKPVFQLYRFDYNIIKATPDSRDWSIVFWPAIGIQNSFLCYLEFEVELFSLVFRQNTFSLEH